MTTAVWLLVIVPAVAVKLAAVAPEATVTDAGTVSAAALLDKVTVIPPDPAVCDNVTVQVEVAPELRLVGLQATELTVVGAASRMEAVCELLL